MQCTSIAIVNVQSCTRLQWNLYNEQYTFKNIIRLWSQKHDIVFPKFVNVTTRAKMNLNWEGVKKQTFDKKTTNIIIITHDSNINSRTFNMFWLVKINGNQYKKNRDKYMYVYLYIANFSYRPYPCVWMWKLKETFCKQCILWMGKYILNDYPMHWQVLWCIVQCGHIILRLTETVTTMLYCTPATCQQTVANNYIITHVDRSIEIGRLLGKKWHDYGSATLHDLHRTELNSIYNIHTLLYKDLVSLHIYRYERKATSKSWKKNLFFTC